MPNMLAAALDFAEKGIPVFPASTDTHLVDEMAKSHDRRSDGVAQQEVAV